MNDILEKIDNLNQREKIILLVTVIVASLVIFIEFVWTPGWTENKILASSQANAENLNETYSAQLLVLEKALQQDPNAKLRAEGEKLRKQLKEKQKQLRESLSLLVPPEDIPEVLVELLAANPELDVLEVVKLPTRKIQKGQGEGAAVLYSHRVQIVVSGRYFDAMRYIQQIEEEPSRLRLISMDYLVKDYPLAVMTLELETLGLDERWLGV